MPSRAVTPISRIDIPTWYHYILKRAKRRLFVHTYVANHIVFVLSPYTDECRSFQILAIFTVSSTFHKNLLPSAYVSRMLRLYTYYLSLIFEMFQLARLGYYKLAAAVQVDTEERTRNGLHHPLPKDIK